MSRVLVCGGAGYIGAHMAKALVHAGHEITVFDNLSTGHRAAVRWGELIEGDLLHRESLAALFRTRRFDAVMHFCALSQVAESVREPYACYRNNVSGTLNLLEAMRNADVRRLVFSSSAAVYGVPAVDKLDELQPTVPINPYGASKLMVETMLQDAASAYGLRSVALRYFNAAGADLQGEIGESHTPETHLIPNVLHLALGKGAELKIFGDDYDTLDGTCVRDYVHVNDLAAAHLQAMRYLDTHEGAHRFNLGSGNGHTVMEVIQAARDITGQPIPITLSPRRPGDPPMLVADSTRAAEILGWKPSFDNISSIIESAWRWHCDPRY